MRRMVMEPISGVILVAMTEPGRTTRDPAKELLCGPFLAANTMANGKKTNATDTENSSGRMVICMKASGKMEEGAAKAN